MQMAESMQNRLKRAITETLWKGGEGCFFRSGFLLEKYWTEWEFVKEHAQYERRLLDA